MPWCSPQPLVDMFPVTVTDVQSEGEKGLSLWTSMQEEGLTASPAFLSTLAALLTACEMKIPFQV